MLAQLLNPSNYQISLYAVPTFLEAELMFLLGALVLAREQFSNQALKEQLSELELFNQITLDREDRILELKQELAKMQLRVQELLEEGEQTK